MTVHVLDAADDPPDGAEGVLDAPIALPEGVVGQASDDMAACRDGV